MDCEECELSCGACQLVFPGMQSPTCRHAKDGTEHARKYLVIRARRLPRLAAIARSCGRHDCSRVLVDGLVLCVASPAHAVKDAVVAHAARAMSSDVDPHDESSFRCVSDDPPLRWPSPSAHQRRLSGTQVAQTAIVTGAISEYSGHGGKHSGVAPVAPPRTGTAQWHTDSLEPFGLSERRVWRRTNCLQTGVLLERVPPPTSSGRCKW